MKNSIFCLGLILLAFSCQKNEPNELPYDPFDAVRKHVNINPGAPDYTVNVPTGFTLLPSSFIVEDHKAQLGRVLFYDKKLSKEGTVSCGSCHLQSAAFSDPKRVSTGVFGLTGQRNSMALGSFASFSGFFGLNQDGSTRKPIFWDGRTFDLKTQVREAFTNEVEMAMTMEEIESTVRMQPYYPLLFQAAYGDSTVSESAIVDALLHFMASLHTFDSKFDKALQKTGEKTGDFPSFSAAENLGKAIYIQHCELCHGSLNSPQIVSEANNGLDSFSVDPGRAGHSGLPFDRGVFKVPALRNIALSSPYMHDGRFQTLDEVIEHYSTGVIRVFGLHGDLLVQNPNGGYSAKHLNLNETEKNALKAFLETLTDENLATVTRFSDPFEF